MELIYPDGRREDDPTEDQIVQLVNTLNPNQPSEFRMVKQEGEWLSIGIDEEGLHMTLRDPNTKLTLTTADTYVSKNNAIVTARGFLTRDPRFNMHATWVPEGQKPSRKKGGFVGKLVALIVIAAIAAGAWYGLKAFGIL